MLQNLGPVSTHDNPNFYKLRLKTPIVKNKTFYSSLATATFIKVKPKLILNHTGQQACWHHFHQCLTFSVDWMVFFFPQYCKKWLHWGSLGRHWQTDGHSNYHTNYITLVPEHYFRNDILWQNYWTISIIRH